jgi:hypothetical protein
MLAINGAKQKLLNGTGRTLVIVHSSIERFFIVKLEDYNPSVFFFSLHNIS